jgi:7tm Odorant receptor
LKKGFINHTHYLFSEQLTHDWKSTENLVFRLLTVRSLFTIEIFEFKKLLKSVISFVGEVVAFIDLLAYFTTCFLQISYYGNDISVSSNKLSSSLFHSDWNSEGRKFKTPMKLFMENTRQPIKFATAFGVFKVDLVTFLWICNAAYSMYSVLRSMN